MTYFVVTREEYSGWDCSGHNVPYIVAAQDETEARLVFPSGINDDVIVSVRPLILPDLKRKKKPVIVV